MPIARVGNHEPALTTPGRIPIFAANHARVRPARDANVRVVLLRAVNVIRKCVVDCDVIELRGRLIILRRPRFAAVDRDARAAVVCVADAVRILWINPEAVMMPMARREEIECLAAVHRFERAGI